MRKFIIERELPKIGSAEREQLRDAAKKSNEVLEQLAPDVQWVESYVADDKTFCVYMAKDEGVIRRHAELSGFPATKITEVMRMIDPTPPTGDPPGARGRPRGAPGPRRLRPRAQLPAVPRFRPLFRGVPAGDDGPLA